MEVHPTPGQEDIIRQAIESGRIHRPEDAVEEALSLWEERERQRLEKRSADLKKAQAAGASIRELRKGVTLGGLKLKDLVAEGRR
jgi:hypothetical protein